MQKTLFIATLGLFMLFSAVCSEAAPKVIKNVRVTVNGEKQYFDIFQSPVEPSLWYCGQTKPSVLKRKVGGVEIPEISIIRYQKKDIKKPQNIIEGAHFKMHLALGPSDDTLETLKSKIPKTSDGRPIILSPVPFGAIRLFMQKPDGQKVQLKAESLSGISSLHSSQNVAFSTTLGALDADILDELMRGNTGAKYTLEYNYQYSDPVLSPDIATNRGKQRDFSEKGSEDKAADRILTGSRDFSKIEREANEKAGWERAGQGFIGFGKYAKSIQDMCVFIENDANEWQNAYLSLPFIYKLGEVNIDKIELDVSLIHAKKAYASQKLTWTPEKKWRDSHGAPLVYGVFDLTKLRQQHPDDFNSANFAIKQRIESNGSDVLTGESTCEMIVGDSPISDPLNLAEVLELNPSFLTWSKKSQNGLQQIEVELNESDWKSVKSIKPREENGKLIPPGVSQWLVQYGNAIDTTPLTANIFFVVTSGSKDIKIPWTMNGKNLRKELFALSAIFFDKDWSGK